MMPLQLIGATEAANILGISRKTLTNYRILGFVPFAMQLPSGHYRYDAEALKALRERWNQNDRIRPNNLSTPNPL